VESQLQA